MNLVMKGKFDREENNDNNARFTMVKKRRLEARCRVWTFQKFVKEKNFQQKKSIQRYQFFPT